MTWRKKSIYLHSYPPSYLPTMETSVFHIQCLELELQASCGCRTCEIRPITARADYCNKDTSHHGPWLHPWAVYQWGYIKVQFQCQFCIDLKKVGLQNCDDIVWSSWRSERRSHLKSLAIFLVGIWVILMGWHIYFEGKAVGHCRKLKCCEYFKGRTLFPFMLQKGLQNYTKFAT